MTHVNLIKAQVRDGGGGVTGGSYSNRADITETTHRDSAHGSFTHRNTPEDTMDYTYPDIAKMIDHSLLQPMLTVADLEAGCQLALAYDVASVCILPYYLKHAASLLKG
ncbi:MAG: hypothetical protein KDA58_13405, partial [Planctomycetaceae bacterium]|nr:hypothetical protein [Planctomycetaceae bacterium]